MKQCRGDIWRFHDKGFSIVIPTNGAVRQDGACVMGRGLAKQAAQRYSEFPYTLGRQIKLFGNHVYLDRITRLFSFPVKHHWTEPADLKLIARSVEELKELCRHSSLSILKTKVYMPRVGCGNGGRDWKEVKPILRTLSDDFIVVQWEAEDE